MYFWKVPGESSYLQHGLEFPVNASCLASLRALRDVSAADVCTAGAATEGNSRCNPQTGLLFSVSITCSLSNICPVSILRKRMCWVFSTGEQTTSLQYYGFCQ